MDGVETTPGVLQLEFMSVHLRILWRVLVGMSREDVGSLWRQRFEIDYNDG